MRRGGIVEISVIVIIVIVGGRVLSGVFQPDLSTILIIAAGSTVTTTVVLWFFFRSVRARERARQVRGTDPNGVELAANSVQPASSEDCVLLSSSCTTGWLDWIHGDLWLCADGLIRRSVGLRRTVAHGSARTIEPQARPRRNFPRAERLSIADARRSNRWIAWESIATAETRRGPITDSFHYRLQGGSEGKLLWLRIDDALGPIEAAARSMLGDRFTSA